MQVHSSEFWDKIFKNDYLVVHLRTAATDILCKIHIKEMHSFLQHFGIYSFQINFRNLHNLKGFI